MSEAAGAAGIWRNILRAAWALLGERRCVACSAPIPGSLAVGWPFRRSTPARGPQAGAAPEDFFCPSCMRGLERRSGGYCICCGELAAWPDQPPMPCGDCLASPPPWDRFILYGEYAGLLRKLVLRFKGRGELSLAPGLAALLASHPALAELAESAGDTGQGERAGRAVVPMPLHEKRLAERGFNQAQELAAPLVAAFAAHGFTLAPDLLVREKDNPPQRGLSKEERQRNIRGIFKAVPQTEGKRILLLDDVSTTGATLREAARALLAAGALSVDVVVLARTPARR